MRRRTSKCSPTQLRDRPDWPGYPGQVGRPVPFLLSVLFVIDMDSPAFDPARLRLTASDLPISKSKTTRKLPRHRGGEWFLKGPIPGSWLAQAAALNVRALRLALAIWFEAGVSGHATVRLSAETLRRFSVPKDGCRKGLSELCAAGLISVVPKAGSRPKITIQDVCSSTTDRLPAATIIGANRDGFEA